MALWHLTGKSTYSRFPASGLRKAGLCSCIGFGAQNLALASSFEWGFLLCLLVEGTAGLGVCFGIVLALA